jgi:hypothetical protein
MSLLDIDNSLVCDVYQMPKGNQSIKSVLEDRQYWAKTVDARRVSESKVFAFIS